jgi:hypothetical protein
MDLNVEICTEHFKTDYTLSKNDFTSGHEQVLG